MNTIRTRNPAARTGPGPTTIYISAEDIELARALGHGNASAGVRLALATQVESILNLAEKLPTGIIDPEAPAKLLAEMRELTEAIEAEDRDGALTEVADAVYYAAKCIALAAAMAGISRVEAFVVARAKYGLRAAPGNPKDDAAERAACRAAWLGDAA